MPERLDRYTVGVRSALALLEPLPTRLALRAAQFAVRCPDARLPAPPIAALGGLLRAGGVMCDDAATTATRFRNADLGSFVSAASAMARFNQSIARFAEVFGGRRVPSWRSGWTPLRFSPGDGGRLLEVSGDLTTATHVVVLVPGMTNSLDTVQGLRQRADRLRAELLARARPGQWPVVVLWLGYRTPMVSEPLAAIGSSFAARGGGQLAADVRMLGAGGASVTVVAHSYGTVVAGEAMRAGIDAERVVALGSPGMNATSRAGLRSPSTHLWASSVGSTPSPAARVARAAAGPIGAAASLAGGGVPGLFANAAVPTATILTDVATGRDWASSTTRVGAHGADPALPGFGGATFASNGSGHSAYFDPRSLGLANVALIALGTSPSETSDDLPPARRPTVMRPAAPARPAARPQTSRRAADGH